MWGRRFRPANPSVLSPQASRPGTTSPENIPRLFRAPDYRCGAGGFACQPECSIAANSPTGIPDPGEQTFLFVTWRLAGSVPRFRLPPEPDPPQVSAGRAFIATDRALDRANSGPLWLKDPRIARVVADAFCAGEKERDFYHLRSWVIMPNHVHLLLRPNRSLPDITRWLKGSTARQANLILHRTGQAFWQDESFDHQVRDEAEMGRLVRYIEDNPVCVGLAGTPEGWPWSSAGWQAKPPAPQ